MLTGCVSMWMVVCILEVLGLSMNSLKWFPCSSLEHLASFNSPIQNTLFQLSSPTRMEEEAISIFCYLKGFSSSRSEHHVSGQSENEGGGLTPGWFRGPCSLYRR